MATLRETIQAEIDGYKAKIDVLKAKLQDTGPSTSQVVLGKEYAELTSPRRPSSANNSRKSAKP